jgi:hypothetical protein
MDVIGVIWIGGGRGDLRMGLVIREMDEMREGRRTRRGAREKTGLCTATYLEQQASGVRERAYHKELHSIA